MNGTSQANFHSSSNSHEKDSESYVRTDIKIYEVDNNSVNMSSCTPLSVMYCHPSPTISDPYSRTHATLLQGNGCILPTLCLMKKESHYKIVFQ